MRDQALRVTGVDHAPCCQDEQYCCWWCKRIQVLCKTTDHRTPMASCDLFCGSVQTEKIVLTRRGCHSPHEQKPDVFAQEVLRVVRTHVRKQSTKPAKQSTASASAGQSAAWSQVVDIQLGLCHHRLAHQVPAVAGTGSVRLAAVLVFAKHQHKHCCEVVATSSRGASKQTMACSTRTIALEQVSCWSASTVCICCGSNFSYSRPRVRIGCRTCAACMVIDTCCNNVPTDVHIWHMRMAQEHHHRCNACCKQVLLMASRTGIKIGT